MVGSWWIYPEDAADLRAYHDGKLSKQASDAVLNRVASKAIAEQRALDLDEWSGGEYFTDEFILHMYKCLTGLQVDKPQEAVVFDYDDMAHAKIVGETRRRTGSAIWPITVVKRTCRVASKRPPWSPPTK